MSEKKPTPFRYRLGCLMATLDIKNWKKLHSMIAPEDIYKTREEGFGKETEPHVTILFGFEPEEHVLEKIKSELPIHGPISIPLTKLSFFENAEFDVLKFDVDPKELVKLNEWCRKNFKYKNDHPEYHPHVTLCYLNKGMGEKYARDMSDPVITVATELVYSEPLADGKKKRSTWDIITNKKDA